MTGALLRYDAACRALAEAKTVDEVAEWSDKAAAVREYARRINNRSLEMDAAEIKERAERRRGELLLELKAIGALAEGRSAATVTDQGQLPERVTLEDLHTSRNESSRAQRIAAIPPAQFEQLLATSRQELEVDPRRHAIDVLRERDGPVSGARTVMASRQEPDDSLDYFPTPPWATRALVLRVLPQLGLHAGSLGFVWEPACGEGHIAEVLREYCPRPMVMASDIFDYGYGEEVSDFLAADTNTMADWIITNPPFDDKAIAFVEQAWMLSRIGVAMFFRSQWAVEGVERYETIFRRRPPTCCAFFVERVNLCKGRWDPDGTTATAYCWLVWHHGETPRPPLWIPPGCRTDLTLPDDRERFTAHPVRKGEGGSTHAPHHGEVLPPVKAQSEPPSPTELAGLAEALAGFKLLVLNERLHVRAMAARLADGVAISALDTDYLVRIARKYGFVAARDVEEMPGGDSGPPRAFLTDDARARLAAAFSTQAAVGTAETLPDRGRGQALPTLQPPTTAPQEVEPCR